MTPYGRGEGVSTNSHVFTLIEIMVEILKTGTLEFKGKPCSFVRSWLERKGMQKLCAAFEGKNTVLLLKYVEISFPNHVIKNFCSTSVFSIFFQDLVCPGATCRGI